MGRFRTVSDPEGSSTKDDATCAFCFEYKTGRPSEVAAFSFT